LKLIKLVLMILHRSCALAAFWRSRLNVLFIPVWTLWNLCFWSIHIIVSNCLFKALKIWRCRNLKFLIILNLLFIFWLFF